MYEWDEAKRAANLEKHGFDFDDADSVYESLNKVTFKESGRGEMRWRDLAPVEWANSVLSLVYTKRGYNIGIISLRKASRRERHTYDDFRATK